MFSELDAFFSVTICDFIMRRLLSVFWVVPMLALFMIGCKDEESPNPEQEVEIEDEELQVSDALEVKLQLQTYVFPYEYGNSAKALVNRVSNRAATLDATVGAAILHDNYAAKVSDAEVRGLVSLVARGGSLVYCEPTIKGLSEFMKRVKQTVVALRSEGKLELSERGVAALRSIANMKEDSKGVILPPFVDDDDSDNVLCDVLAIRGYSYYIISDLDDTKNVKVYITEDGLANSNSKIYEMQTEPPTEYMYGLHSDALAQWLDKASDSEEEMKSKGRQLLAQAVGNGESQDLEQIANAQQISYSFNAYAGHKYEPVRISYEIWAVNDTKGADYYLVHQEVRCENSKLKCGPENGNEWNTYKVAAAFGQDGYVAYWAYMTRLITQTEFSNDAVSIEHVSPANNMSGVTNYTENITWSLDAAFVASKDTRASLNGGVKMSKSWTHSIPDLGLTFSYNKNKPQWVYAAGVYPKVYKYGAFKTRVKHDVAKPILRTDCTVGHSWIWKIGNANSTYSFKSRVNVDLQGLFKVSGGFSNAYKTFTNENIKTITLNPPPRYEQKWIVEMVPYNKDTADYLTKYFGWNASFSLYTVEKDDRNGIDTHISEMERILNTHKEGLKDAGIGSFTLNWKLLDSATVYKSYTYTPE